jgi:hypothetical protein
MALLKALCWAFIFIIRTRIYSNQNIGVKIYRKKYLRENIQLTKILA